MQQFWEKREAVLIIEKHVSPGMRSQMKHLNCYLASLTKFVLFVYNSKFINPIPWYVYVVWFLKLWGLATAHCTKINCIIAFFLSFFLFMRFCESERSYYYTYERQRATSKKTLVLQRKLTADILYQYKSVVQLEELLNTLHKNYYFNLFSF